MGGGAVGTVEDVEITVVVDEQVGVLVRVHVGVGADRDSVAELLGLVVVAGHGGSVLHVAEREERLVHRRGVHGHGPGPGAVRRVRAAVDRAGPGRHAVLRAARVPHAPGPEKRVGIAGIAELGGPERQLPLFARVAALAVVEEVERGRPIGPGRRRGVAEVQVDDLGALAGDGWQAHPDHGSSEARLVGIHPVGQQASCLGIAEAEVAAGGLGLGEVEVRRGQLHLDRVVREGTRPPGVVNPAHEAMPPCGQVHVGHPRTSFLCDGSGTKGEAYRADDPHGPSVAPNTWRVAC